MKKTRLSRFFALFLMVNFVLSVFAYQTNLRGLYGDHNKSNDGAIIVNKTGGNNLILSQTKADAFSYEVEFEFLEGSCFSLVYGYTGNGFYGVEIARSGAGLGENELYLKGFRDGDDSGIFFERIKVNNVNTNQAIHFKIIVTENNLLSIYINDNLCHQHTIKNYKIGYLGVLSFQSKVKLSNINVEIGDIPGIQANLENLSGDFSETKPIYTVFRKNQANNLVLSQTEYSTISIEGTVEILNWQVDQNRMSFVFGYKADGDGYASELLIKDENQVQIKAFKVGDNGGDIFVEEHNINTTKPINYKIDINEDNVLKVYLNGNQVKEIALNHYQGGRWGFLTWNTMAGISNFTVKTRDNGSVQQISEEELSGMGGNNSFYSKSDISYIVNRREGNNLAISTTSASAFSFEGNIEILEGDRMSFVFGAVGDLGSRWFGTELRIVNENRVAIKSFREGDSELFNQEFEINTTRAIPFKIELTKTGRLTVYLNNEKVKQAIFPAYKAGRLGLLTYNSKAKVSDILVLIKDSGNDGEFRTNTYDWKQDKGTTGYWRITSEGLRGTGSSNSPYFSATSATNFRYEADIKYLSQDIQAGGLVFRANEDHSVYYAVDINNNSESVRVLKFYKDPETGSISDITVGGVEGNLRTLPNYKKKNNFNLRIEAIHSNILVYIDNHLLVVTDDDEVLEGYFGITNFNSEMLFQDLYFTEISTLPLLTSMGASVELTPIFSNSTFKYLAIVDYETEKISLDLTTETFNDIFVNENSITTDEPYVVSLNEGNNIIWIQVQDKESGASTITELTIKRRYNPKTAYLENYRPQFHYSPEANWMNDPNGMVYYEGEYHLFYQYHPYSKQWGTMHWGHAISTDMVHWKEYPIALYPDKFGTIFSGSAVVDHKNTSGFFTDTDEKKGLVAFYTSAGRTQQQSIAYSTDKGRTWTKYKNGEPVIKTEDDPMNHGDFRDPKVFWHEESNQWMMVVAGGPLRFYSSTNLKNWTFESGYNNEQVIDGVFVNAIHTECPDFFKLSVEGSSQEKWVLVRSSKSYMIGEFKKIGNNWFFIPDSNTSINPNFGNDVYAGQTFSDTPDGRRIMIHWMTNFDYSGDLANVTDPYNGAFTMAYELKLKETNEGIRLYQTPIQEYESLRKPAHSFKKKTISAQDENILKDIKSQQFEIVATVTPATGTTQFGFNLRVGNGQLTKVFYNMRNQQLVVDRTQSGTTPNDKFAKVFSKRTQLINGKIQLHIFVDWSSIEVFANDGAELASALIFPDPESQDMEFFVVGEAVECDIDIYPLKSIWREDTDTNIFTLKKEGEFEANIYITENGLIIKTPNPDNRIHTELFNLSGEKLFAKQLSHIDTSIVLSQGVYLVKLFNENRNQSWTEKVIIQ